MDEDRVVRLAQKYNKTPGQILLRWGLQKVWRHTIDSVPTACLPWLQEFVILPKSVTPSRIEENAKLYDFELSEEDMKTLHTGVYEPCAWDPTTSHD